METGKMDEHVPGSMDIRVQEKTFSAFIRLVAWSAGITVLVLIIMALADA
jgi:Ni,Fe-hydrogenase I cytochrome b subunit